MNLQEWDKRDTEFTAELVQKCVTKLNRGEPINPTKDIVPEWEDLSDKNYTVWPTPGNPQTAEEYPNANLSQMLACGQYDYVLFPLHPLPNLNQFKYNYGLGSSRGCRITYEQLKQLVERKTVRPYLNSAPIYYRSRFYEEIFKVCESQGYLPPFVPERTSRLMERIKLSELAWRSNVSLSEGWVETVHRLHPHYVIKNCEDEIRKHLDRDALEEILAEHHYLDYEEVVRSGGSFLYSLRVYGLESLANVSMNIMKEFPQIGFRVLNGYWHFLIAPIGTALSCRDYDVSQVEAMSFLELLPSVTPYWKDILSSSPSASSLISPSLEMRLVRLEGGELLRLIADPEVEMKTSRVEFNIAMNRMDLKEALTKFRRIDEIMRERYNKKLEDYSRAKSKGKIILSFGKRIASATQALAWIPLFQEITKKPGPFTWLPLTLIVAGKWLEEKLKSIRPEDIVRWWVEKWPLEDPGVSFTLWQAGTRK